MKKIVTTIAALAMAVSMFAADVSAKVHVEGSLLNVNGDNITALTIGHKAQPWNPDFALSANGDKAGASVSFVSEGADALSNTTFGITAQNYSIWFKPFDVLKVTLGHYSTNMNQETIDYSHTETGVDTQGYAIDLNVDAFFATVFFAPGWGNSWLSAKKDADVEFGQLYAKAGYGADFGRIQAMYRLVDMKNAWTGVGYDNTFGSVKMFVNALAGFGPDKAFAIRGEAFASTNIDAFGIAAFVAGGYCAKEGVPGGLSGWRIGQPVADKVSLGATMKLTYNLGSCTPYIYVKEANFLADSFSINVKPGVTGNLGSMAWEVAADMNFGETFTVNVPVSFTVSF